MSNTYTDQTTTAPILNYYKTEAELTGQPNPSVTELHMVPLTDTIVEVYGDNTNGYRIWSSGWIEQWGGGQGVSYGSGYGGTGTVNLPHAFANNTYVVVVTLSKSSYSNVISVTDRATATFSWGKDSNNTSGASGYFYWYACGY